MIRFSVVCFMLILNKRYKINMSFGDDMGREEGGGFRMGNTCIPVADSF